MKGLKPNRIDLIVDIKHAHLLTLVRKTAPLRLVLEVNSRRVRVASAQIPSGSELCVVHDGYQAYNPIELPDRYLAPLDETSRKPLTAAVSTLAMETDSPPHLTK